MPAVSTCVGERGVGGWRLTGVVMVAAALAACDKAPIEGKACGCVAPYVCCASQNVCLAPGEICVDAGKWPIDASARQPRPMDRYTVFAASQDGLDKQDEQVFALQPDLILRGWSQWSQYGVQEADYTDPTVNAFGYVQRAHDSGIAFLGGAATSVVFPDQFNGNRDDPQFKDFTTVDASGAPVVHDQLSPRMQRATLANPRFRDYVVRIAKYQLDGGVDGLNFDELNEGYEGLDYTGNEGFDDYNLADFNAFLLAKYPGADFRRMFSLPADNTLRADLPAGDLKNNFNYRKLLGTLGSAGDPFGAELDPALRLRSPSNPLAEEWGGAWSDRPAPAASSFVDQAVPYRYWRDIVDKVRAAAGRPILISAKGIYPFVDFQSVALNNYAPECLLTESMDKNCYVPLADGRLDGARSLQWAFRILKNTSQQFAPGAPVVLYLDGPWPEYDALTDQERADYWRIYAAEAYANGLFYAFRLTTAHAPSEHPQTAEEGHVLDTMKALATFYRSNARLYHGVQTADVAVTTSLPPSSVMVAVSDRADPPARLVHLVNHDYAGGLVPRTDVTVEIPVAAPVTSVQLISPDLADPVPVTATTSATVPGQIVVQLPSLLAYDVIVVSY